MNQTTTPSQRSDILTISEAATYLKLPVSTVYRLVERRAIPSYKVGRQWRFQRPVIDEWLRRRSETISATILVVDDEEEVRAVMAEALGGEGRKILQARNGLEALRWVDSVPVDLILLDLMMPEMDGVETFRRVHSAHPELPVAIVTGYTESDLMVKALDIGPFTVLSKPVDIHKLQKVVSQIVGP